MYCSWVCCLEAQSSANVLVFVLRHTSVLAGGGDTLRGYPVCPLVPQLSGSDAMCCSVTPYSLAWDEGEMKKKIVCAFSLNYIRLFDQGSKNTLLFIWTLHWKFTSPVVH